MLAANAMSLALLVVLTPGCATRPAKPVAPTAASPPAAEIYAAVIGASFKPRPDGPLSIVATLRAPPELFGDLDHPLWPALMEASSLQMAMPADLPVPLAYELVSERGSDAPRRERTPHNPVVSFSAIGYDASEDRALVWIEWHCGPECGGGGYYELERRGEVWGTVNYFHRFDS